jgi:lambda repressor-like predicted transcriptional regulator
MKWLKKYFTPEDKNKQGNRNKRALECLKALAFEPVGIRKALIELNGLKVKDLSRQDGVSPATIYNTIRGQRINRKAIELISRSLELSVEDLFSGGADDPS